MPSHNCINKLQCSVFKVHLWVSLSRDSMKPQPKLELQSISQFCILHFAFKRSGGPKWTRFSAEKPRRLKQSTGLFPRAGFRVPYRTQSSNSSAPIQALWEVVGQNGLEPSTSRLSVVCSSQLSYWPIWWRLAGSNRWPPACKAGALPAELNPHMFFTICKVHCFLYPLNWITKSS